jgi:hypothetical protein
VERRIGADPHDGRELRERIRIINRVRFGDVPGGKFDSPHDVLMIDEVAPRRNVDRGVEPLRGPFHPFVVDFRDDAVTAVGGILERERCARTVCLLDVPVPRPRRERHGRPGVTGGDGLERCGPCNVTNDEPKKRIVFGRVREHTIRNPQDTSVEELEHDAVFDDVEAM